MFTLPMMPEPDRLAATATDIAAAAAVAAVVAATETMRRAPLPTPTCSWRVSTLILGNHFLLLGILLVVLNLKRQTEIAAVGALSSAEVPADVGDGDVFKLL